MRLIKKHLRYRSPFHSVEIQREDGFADALEGIALPDAGVGVGLFAHTRPPAVEVAADCARTDHPQVVLFG